MKKAAMEPDFAHRVLRWFEQHGRTDLPWQRDRTPYRIWVSEIMLQQTQVATVIPYFERFVSSFPDVVTLADADADSVLHHWSGLGYYARARNLHRTARIICDEYSGRFPDTFDDVLALPGIGRSTAGAILSLAGGQRHSILDGNVKRVLARYTGVMNWPGETETLKQLWTLAERLTPACGVADYNQAMMDLGATLCTRTRPRCGDCPLTANCVARKDSLQDRIPAPKPRRERPVRRSTMLLVRNCDDAVLLQQRPPSGIWGGLWCLPELKDCDDVVLWCERKLGSRPSGSEQWSPVRHTFTHFHLDITPVSVKIDNRIDRVMEDGASLWYNVRAPEPLGIAAPVQRLIDQLDEG